MLRELGYLSLYFATSGHPGFPASFVSPTGTTAGNGGSICEHASTAFYDDSQKWTLRATSTFQKFPPLWKNERRTLVKLCEHVQTISRHLKVWEYFELKPNFTSTAKFLSNHSWPLILYFHNSLSVEVKNDNGRTASEKGVIPCLPTYSTHKRFRRVELEC